jgi:hypothetical protein
MRSLLGKPERRGREGNRAIQAFGDLLPQRITKPKCIPFRIALIVTIP